MTRPLPPLDDEEFRKLATLAVEDGFGALATDRGNLPLRSIDVRGRIDGLLARITLHQTFVNATDSPLEATYIFPLPDRSAVTDFRMTVAGRLVEGALEERSKARVTYDRAIRQGHRASIAEEERPGVFTLRVGNLLPGEEATVGLTFAGLLPYDGGEVTFRFPLVVAPRYIPGIPLDGPSVGDGVAVDTDAVPDASRIAPPLLLPGFPNPVRLTLEVELHDGPLAVADVRSSLHAVEEDAGPGARLIRLRPGERLDRDFVLRFRLAGDAVRSSLVLRPDPEGDEGTFALTIIPPEGATAATKPRDVVFVLDHSGSMEGWKMVAARRAVARMIETLTDADRFALLAFSDRPQGPPGLDDGLVAAGDRLRFRASEFLAGLRASGGTEMAAPLSLAADWLAAAGQARDRLLVLVTDGQVGNEDQILQAIGPKLAGARVFALGIDRAVNEGFLRRLADLGGGSCEVVESSGRLDEAMDGIHRRIGAPILDGLRIDPGGLEVEPDTLVPDRVPALFPGIPLMLQGRYRGAPSGPVVLRARDAAGAEWREAVEPTVRENPAVATTWARGLLRTLEDRYAVARGDARALEARIVATSLRFGVLCRFTAYVAVDRSRVANEGGEVHRLTQPVETPSGWASPGRFPPVMLSAAPAMLSIEASEPSMEDSEFICGYGVSVRPALFATHKRRSRPMADSSPTPPPAPTPPSILETATATSGEADREDLPDPEGDEWRKVIGLGGMGRAFRTYTSRRGRRLAIHFIPIRADDSAKLAELRGDLVALKALAHPGIVPLLDARIEGGRLILVRPYLSGKSLDSRLRSGGPLPPRQAAEMAMKIGGALEFLHGQGRGHGGLAPQEIWLRDDGEPAVLVDPKLPGADGSGLIGRPAYMAPELVRGGPPSPSGDLYALGVILYELLTGRRPFAAGSTALLLQAVLDAKVTPPGRLRRGIPKVLEAICLKLMAPEPADRYATAREAVAALRQYHGRGRLRSLLPW